MIQTYLMDGFPNESMGGDLGAIRTIYIGIGSLGPTYVGAVASGFSYLMAFTGLIGFLALASVLLVTIPLTARHE